MVAAAMKKYMRGQILALAWPVVMEGLAAMLMNVMVTGMVGSLGAVALAGMGLAGMIQASLVMLLAAAGTGAAAIVARETGAGEWQTVRMITGQALMLGLSLGIILAALGALAADFLFAALGAEAAVTALAAKLVRIMFFFMPFQLTMAIANAALRGMGKTRVAFLNTIVSNLLALLIAPALIFGWGVPALGVYGAAWGMGIAYLGGLGLALFLLAKRSTMSLRLQDVFCFRLQAIRRILAISIPTVLEQASLQTGRLAFNIILVGVGTAQFAANQIANQVESISFMPGFGFSVAAMTLVGQNLGKGLPHRADRYVRETAKIAFCAMTVMGFFIFIFARPLTSLFITDPEVIYWGTLCVMVAVLEQPTLGLTFVLAGALRGAGDTRWPMYITFTGVWLCRLPLGYVLIGLWGWDITAAWYITAADFLVRTVILWQRFASGKWSRKDSAQQG